MMDDEKRRVFLIRHGETDYNAERKIQGCVGDCPLNERGQYQAKLTALALRRFEFRGSRIISSDLLRSKQTATTIKEVLAMLSFNLEFSSKPEFNEMDYGDWEGKSFEEVQRLFPEERNRWVLNPTDEFFFSGASQTLGQKRIEAIDSYKEVVRDWLETPTDIKKLNDDIIFVLHGIINRILLFDILKTPFSSWLDIRQENCCINIIDYSYFWDGIPLSEPKATIELINGTDHLMGLC